MAFDGKGPGEQFSVFAGRSSKSDRLFREIAGYSVLEKPSETETGDQAMPTEWAQPLNLFFQIALARLLQSFGVQPSAIVGHSVGEIAAFHFRGR